MLTVGVAFFTITGCNLNVRQSHEQTVRDGVRTVPHVSEIITIFTNAPTDHFITQFGFYENKPVQWHTVVYFGGRYTFAYQVDVEVDYKHNKIAKTVGKPQFYLVELDTIRGGGSTTKQGFQFGESQWTKIVAAKGDFSAAGIQLNTNAPLAGFDEYVRQWRAPQHPTH